LVQELVEKESLFCVLDYRCAVLNLRGVNQDEKYDGGKSISADARITDEILKPMPAETQYEGSV
jgi:hypothetical protein